MGCRGVDIAAFTFCDNSNASNLSKQVNGKLIKSPTSSLSELFQKQFEDLTTLVIQLQNQVLSISKLFDAQQGPKPRHGTDALSKNESESESEPAPNLFGDPSDDDEGSSSPSVPEITVGGPTNCNEEDTKEEPALDLSDDEDDQEEKETKLEWRHGSTWTHSQDNRISTGPPGALTRLQLNRRIYLIKKKLATLENPVKLRSKQVELDSCCFFMRELYGCKPFSFLMS